MEDLLLPIDGHYVLTERILFDQALQQRLATDQAAGDTNAQSQLTSVQAELDRTSGHLKAVTAEVDQLKQQNEVSSMLWFYCHGIS